MLFNSRSIKIIYRILKSDIKYNYTKKRYRRLFSLIDIYADVAQRINDIFRDDYIEDILRSLGKNKIGEVHDLPYKPIHQRIVFYDQICTTVCLSLQYLRALVSNGYEVFYIAEAQQYTINSALIKEIKNTCLEYYIITKPYPRDIIGFGKTIQNKIIEFKSSKIIIQSPAFGSLGASIMYSLTCMQRYRIVPGDHHFYIGVDCIDYFLEFRNFGIDIAFFERKIPTSKIYKLLYYPVIKLDVNIEFKGFPSECNGKTIIISAGNKYKFWGSDQFLNMCKDILLTHNECAILIVGFKSRSISNFIKKERLEKRLFLLGYRQDFVECIKRCDILMNSFPISGGLVVQTAAYYNKPILAYCNKETYIRENISSLFNSNSGISSFTSINKFYSYATNLITDRNFRISEGEKYKFSLPTKLQFEKNLSHILEGDYGTTKLKPLHISTKKWYEYYIMLQNKNAGNSIIYALINGFNFNIYIHFYDLHKWLLRNTGLVLYCLGLKFLKKIYYRYHAI